MSAIAIAPRELAASRAAAAVSGVASALSDTADVAWRNLLIQLRTPQALVFATVQPVIFVLLFRYAFGGAIRVPGTNYVDFLMPGIFAQTVAFGAVGTAVGLSGDLRTGILVRFRTLPMARIAVLGGRTVADLARNLLVVVVMTGVGFAAGFRSPHGAGGLLRQQRCLSCSCSSSPPPPSCQPPPCPAGCRRSAPTSRSTPWSTRNGR
jgi:ABC-2 type transport system permease protein/oleandomycin transport system permease protein